MPKKKVAHRERKPKKENSTMATKWVPSKFKESDLVKPKKEGLLATDALIVFPGTERIPKPPERPSSDVSRFSPARSFFPCP
jgi:hypothetical protein